MINDIIIDNDVGKKVSHYLISGFSLVTALSFNDLISKAINKFYPLQTDALIAKTVYCITLVIFLVLLIKFLPNTVNEIPEKSREMFGLEPELNPSDFRNMNLKNMNVKN